MQNLHHGVCPRHSEHSPIRHYNLSPSSSTFPVIPTVLKISSVHFSPPKICTAFLPTTAATTELDTRWPLLPPNRVYLPCSCPELNKHGELGVLHRRHREEMDVTASPNPATVQRHMTSLKSPICVTLESENEGVCARACGHTHTHPNNDDMGPPTQSLQSMHSPIGS